MASQKTLLAKKEEFKCLAMKGIEPAAAAKAKINGLLGDPATWLA